MLPAANAVKRQTVPARHLILGLQCGGSDGFSAITANPALGVAADLLVRNGGTSILSETPEIYGAEHMLLGRAVSDEVGQQAARPAALVGELRRQEWRDPRQQPLAGQQGGRADHHPREVAGRGRQGRATAIWSRSTAMPSR